MDILETLYLFCYWPVVASAFLLCRNASARWTIFILACLSALSPVVSTLATRLVPSAASLVYHCVFLVLFYLAYRHAIIHKHRIANFFYQNRFFLGWSRAMPPSAWLFFAPELAMLRVLMAYMLCHALSAIYVIAHHITVIMQINVELAWIYHAAITMNVICNVLECALIVALLHASNRYQRRVAV